MDGNATDCIVEGLYSCKRRKCRLRSLAWLLIKKARTRTLQHGLGSERGAGRLGRAKAWANQGEHV